MNEIRSKNVEEIKPNLMEEIKAHLVGVVKSNVVYENSPNLVAEAKTQVQCDLAQEATAQLTREARDISRVPVEEARTSFMDEVRSTVQAELTPTRTKLDEIMADLIVLHKTHDSKAQPSDSLTPNLKYQPNEPLLASTEPSPVNSFSHSSDGEPSAPHAHDPGFEETDTDPTPDPLVTHPDRLKRSSPLPNQEVPGNNSTPAQPVAAPAGPSSLSNVVPARTSAPSAAEPGSAFAPPTAVPGVTSTPSVADPERNSAPPATVPAITSVPSAADPTADAVTSTSLPVPADPRLADPRFAARALAVRKANTHTAALPAPAASNIKPVASTSKTLAPQAAQGLSSTIEQTQPAGSAVEPPAASRPELASDTHPVDPRRLSVSTSTSINLIPAPDTTAGTSKNKKGARLWLQLQESQFASLPEPARLQAVAVALPGGTAKLWYTKLTYAFEQEDLDLT